jgi:hypothetical protein
MGSFIALYGIDETVNLIRRVLDGESLGTDWLLIYTDSQ